MEYLDKLKDVSYTKEEISDDEYGFSDDEKWTPLDDIDNVLVDIESRLVKIRDFIEDDDKENALELLYDLYYDL